MPRGLRIGALADMNKHEDLFSRRIVLQKTRAKYLATGYLTSVKRSADLGQITQMRKI